MTNPYLEYYTNQAGSGLTGFQGYQYQRGHGFFGSLFQNILKPLGKYLGRQALATGVNVGSDLLENHNIKDSLKKNIKMTSKNMLKDAITRATKFAQTGSGKKRRKRNRKKSKIRKKKIPIKKNNLKSKSLVKKKAKRKRSSKNNLRSKFAKLIL